MSDFPNFDWNGTNQIMRKYVHFQRMLWHPLMFTCIVLSSLALETPRDFFYKAFRPCNKYTNCIPSFVKIIQGVYSVVFIRLLQPKIFQVQFWPSPLNYDLENIQHRWVGLILMHCMWKCARNNPRKNYCCWTTATWKMMESHNSLPPRKVDTGHCLFSFLCIREGSLVSVSIQDHGIW